ncbi:sensor domain-containing diguanylate cyclase [Halioxenophilus aromaticivorans]
MAGVSAHASVVLDNDSQSVNLSRYMSILEDVSGELTLPDILALNSNDGFTAINDEHLQLGYSTSAFWLRFSVSNRLPASDISALEDRFYLTLKYPLLDSVDFYRVAGDDIVQLKEGDMLPFHQRLFAVSDYVFPFSLAKHGSATLFVRVASSSSLPIPLRLQTEKAFVENSSKEDMLNGIYVGISVGLGVYNLILFLIIRSRAHGFYVLMVFSIMMFNTGMAGLTYRFWPESIQFQQMNIYLWSFTSAVLVPLFGMEFLKTKESFPRFHSVLKLLVWLNLLVIPCLWWVSVATAAKLTVVFTGVTALSVIFVAISRVFQGFTPAIYYTIGQGAVIGSVIFTAVTSQKVIPLYHLAPEVMKWCSAFELMLFSIGLAGIVTTERRLREQAQRESAKAQKALLDSQIKRNEDLDVLVEQRTRELESLNLQLLRLSNQDELTGMHNRRYLNESLIKEYEQARANQKPISILMIDIDHFKLINDHYGHQFGDFCLQAAGSILHANTHRPPDVCARYGGEEFVVVLPDTSLKNATIVAEKIRRNFENYDFCFHEDHAQVSVSIGVCCETPSPIDHHELLLNRADELLYQAKSEGRNRVVVQPPESGSQLVPVS